MMAVGCRDFYDLAERIQRNNLTREEIYFRSSINRAYYGAFHAAATRLRISTTKEGATHKDVIGRLTDIEPDLGEKLDKLFKCRWKADYDTSSETAWSEGDKAIRLANEI